MTFILRAGRCSSSSVAWRLPVDVCLQRIYLLAICRFLGYWLSLHAVWLTCDSVAYPGCDKHLFILAAQSRHRLCWGLDALPGSELTGLHVGTRWLAKTLWSVACRWCCAAAYLSLYTDLLPRILSRLLAGKNRAGSASLSPPHRQITIFTRLGAPVKLHSCWPASSR